MTEDRNLYFPQCIDCPNKSYVERYVFLNTPRIYQNPPDTNESPKFERLHHHSASDISVVFRRFDILRVFLWITASPNPVI